MSYESATPPFPPKTAFVLGGGGVLGATQIGGLKALIESGVRPDVVLGTSIGAVNGSFVAANPTSDGLDELAELWAHLASSRALFESAGSTSNAARRGARKWKPSRLRTHLYSPGPMLRLLREHLPVQNFEDLDTPFQCVAASLERAVAHWFTEGPLPEAIVASCAVPGLFPPMRIGDEHFLDGGLVHSIPVGRAVALGAKDIYVLHVGRVEQELQPPRWPWEVGQVTFEIARRHRYMEEISSVPEGVRLHIMPSGSDEVPMVSLLHMNRAFVTKRIDAAYEAAVSFLDSSSA